MIELTGKLPKYCRNTGNLIDPRFNINGFNEQRDYPKRSYAETYAITWTSKKEMGFELPTGGGAIMHEGENIMYFARKEQCLALGTQLKTDLKPKIKDYKIYRIYKNGEIEFLYPKDGVVSERVNEGREKANHVPRRIGQNPDPVTVKWSSKNTYD